jgi:hypothetical protein
VRWPADVAIRRLREHGWLLDLATRGVWEFAPAARAGAYGSGDPLVELRATLARVHAVRARELLSAAPHGGGPYYLGERRREGRNAREFDVVDSTGFQVGAQ